MGVKLLNAKYLYISLIKKVLIMGKVLKDIEDIDFKLINIK